MPSTCQEVGWVCFCSEDLLGGRRIGEELDRKGRGGGRGGLFTTIQRSSDPPP